ncbi:MAG: hypothetical protein ACON5D_09495 [Rubripirellula sp.]
MMPPNCCLCSRGVESGDPCELIRFARSSADHQWYVERESGRSETDHPPDMDWFCSEHEATAFAHQHLTRKEAIESITNRERWFLIDLDLFDRGTPPAVRESGVGFESAFSTYFDHAVSTINDDGDPLWTQYRISLGGDVADMAVNGEGVFEIQRTGKLMLEIKKRLASKVDGVGFSDLISKRFALETRKHGVGSALHLVDEISDHLRIALSDERFLALFRMV